MDGRDRHVHQTETDPRSTVPGGVHGGRYVDGAAAPTVLPGPTEVPVPSCQKSST